MRQQSGPKRRSRAWRLLHPHPTIPHHRLILPNHGVDPGDRKNRIELPTAEQAANQNVERREEWYEICERLASQRRAEDALPAAKQSIDRYFELDLPSYELIDAEREFELEIDGHKLLPGSSMPSTERRMVSFSSSSTTRQLNVTATYTTISNSRSTS